MFQATEMLLHESESISAKKKHDLAFKAQYERRSKGRANRPNKNTAKFEVKCFRCKKYGTNKRIVGKVTRPKAKKPMHSPLFKNREGVGFWTVAQAATCVPTKVNLPSYKH